MLDRLSNEDIMREYTLSNVIRYNNRIRLTDESVAEHTCFVSVFCLKILAQIRDAFPHFVSNNHVEFLKLERDVLILATLHDMPESLTSDIPHNVKMAFPAFNDILRDLENDYYIRHWFTYYPDVMFPTNIEFAILKLADAYSVLQYCMNEQSLGNVSKDVKEIILDAEQRVLTQINNINEMLSMEEPYEE